MNKQFEKLNDELRRESAFFMLRAIMRMHSEDVKGPSPKEGGE